MKTATTKPLIYAAEAWTADEQGSLRPTSSFQDLPSSLSKQIVERTTSRAAPIVAKVEDLESTNGAANHFNALVGLPVIKTNQIVGCTVLAISCSADSMGAFEIWHRDERDELGLNGAVFSGLSRFASISQHVRFPRGSGLPGQSWEDSEAKLLTGLGSSPNFMRAAGARAGGLDIGVALPFFKTEHDLNSVVLLLSATSSPISRVFEIWDVSGETATIRKAAGDLETATIAEVNDIEYKRGEGIVGKVWESGLPMVSDDLAAVGRKRLGSLMADGFSSVIAMPVTVGNRIESIFVMFN